jgi:XTP/dITP diphosphohydrolase
MTTLLLATRNQGKKREIENFLRDGELKIRLLSLIDVNTTDEVSESGATFAENALLKADFYSQLTGLDTLGDDSGLEVMALGGRPGVFSARYAGEGAGDDARIQKLLAEMKGVTDRRARFVSAVCISRNGSALAAFSGQVEGEILFAKRGEGGFGYDPLFLYPPLGKTFAELTVEEKNRISHRARALAHVKKFVLAKGLAG